MMTIKQSRRFSYAVACSIALVMLAGQPTSAQQTRTPAADDRALVEQLLKRVEELEQQVKALQQSERGAPADASRSAESATTVGLSGSTQGSGDMRDVIAPAGLGALQIRGFSDLDFHAAQAGDQPNTFSLGQLDLFLSSRLGTDFSTVGEVVFEAGENNAIGIDVERILLQYSPSDMFNVAAGRYHTGIGYYNAAYHHGNWFQTAIGRPFIFRFEDDGGILPVHGVGLTAQGRIPSGGAGLRYLAEISNGRGTRLPGDEPVQNVVDENGGKAVNLALLARPASLPGLQAGFSVYRDRLRPAQAPSIAETIMAAHVVYQSPVFEQLNEAIFIRHAPADASRVTTTTSAYSQISRQFGRYRPYFRYEYLDVPAMDGVFGDDIGRLYGPSVGVKYDAAAPVALKLQYDRLTGRARSRTNGLTAQLAFTF